MTSYIQTIWNVVSATLIACFVIWVIAKNYPVSLSVVSKVAADETGTVVEVKKAVVTETIKAPVIEVDKAPVIEVDKAPVIEVNEAAIEAHNSSHSADVIHIASELGRLDIVSLSLTVLGVVLAFTAFFGFVHLKAQTIAEAKKQAKETATIEAELVAKQKAEQAVEEFLVSDEFIAAVNNKIAQLVPVAVSELIDVYGQDPGAAEDFSRSMD